MVEAEGMRGHEEVGGGRGVSFWDNNGKDLGGTMLFCIDMKAGLENGNMAGWE